MSTLFKCYCEYDKDKKYVKLIRFTWKIYRLDRYVDKY